MTMTALGRANAPTLISDRGPAMGWPARLLFCLIAACSFTSCKSRPPRAEDFSTPSESVRTLQDALAAEDSIALYRCLSEGFKERTGLGAIGTDIALKFLRDEYPEIQYIESGELVAEQRLGADYAFVEVEVGFLFFTRNVRFVLERRTMAEIRREGLAAPIGMYMPLGSRVLDSADSHPEEPTVAFIVTNAPDLWEQLQVEEPPLTSFQIVDVWKVHAIAVSEEEMQALEGAGSAGSSP